MLTDDSTPLCTCKMAHESVFSHTHQALDAALRLQKEETIALEVQTAALRDRAGAKGEAALAAINAEISKLTVECVPPLY